jgi:hypothetical protein
MGKKNHIDLGGVEGKRLMVPFMRIFGTLRESTIDEKAEPVSLQEIAGTGYRPRCAEKL